jgi:hypothetical protein
MQYYIDTESILNSITGILAQAYGEGTFNSDVYSGDSTTTPVDPTDPTNPETPGTTTPGIPGVPNTGVFAEQPMLLIPVILAAAVLIAGVVLIIKRTVRRIRG